MKTSAKCLVGLASIIFFFTAYSSAPVNTDAAPPVGKYIEVCSNGTVYVPPETKFVTCYGRIMRVIAIVSTGLRSNRTRTAIVRGVATGRAQSPSLVVVGCCARPIWGADLIVKLF